MKDDLDYGEEEEMFRLKKQKSSKERRPETVLLYDNLWPFLDRT